MNRSLIHLGILLLVGLLCCLPETAEAQCAMCKAAPQTNLASGGTDATGLNKGIFMLFLAPYTIVGIIGFVWWRNRRRTQEEVSSEELQAELNAVFNEEVG